MPTTKKAQPARKAQPAKKQASSPKPTANSTAGAGEVWKWVYIVGIIVAGLVKVFSGALPAGLDVAIYYLLVLAAILSGIFFLDTADIVNFGIRYLLLLAVAGTLSGLEFGSFSLGGYLTDFFQGIVLFLGQAGLTLLVVYFWKKYFSGKM